MPQAAGISVMVDQRHPSLEASAQLDLNFNFNFNALQRTTISIPESIRTLVRQMEHIHRNLGIHQ